MRAAKTLLAFLFLFTGTVSTEAQNLIPHGDFENFTRFDEYDFGYKRLENNPTTWHNPTKAGPKVYYDPKTAKSGANFTGIHMIGVSRYREYITTPLTCRLIAGETYVLRFYVKLSDNSEFAVSSFGGLLSQGDISSPYTTRLKDTPQVFVDNKSFFTERRGWQLVEDSFVASGGESYLTIGNFLDDESTVTKKVAFMAQQGKAYYYIDDVALYPVTGKDPCQALLDSSVCEQTIISELNMLYDPSFECFSECPANINTHELTQLTHWKQTSHGTPDYFNSCSIIMSTPQNIMGNEAPHAGAGYTGIYMFDAGNYREYLSGKLVQPMAKKQWYVITLYAALSEGSNYSTDAFEFMVTEELPSIDVGDTNKLAEGTPDDTASVNDLMKEIIEDDAKRLEKLTPQVINTPGNFADSYTWKKICGVYLAEGGERYITLGNFKNDEETGLKRIGSGNGRFAYYFIDDFTVEPLTANNMSECGAGVSVTEVPDKKLTTPRYYSNLTVPQLVNGQPFSFEGFYFEFDKYDIIDSNYAYLDSLVEMMYDDPMLKVEVYGHTDYVGSNRYNLRLSKNRAKAVVDYFLEQGIDKERITYDYFGATRPVASNLTPDGRQKNRRVEFVLRRG